MADHSANQAMISKLSGSAEREEYMSETEKDMLTTTFTFFTFEQWKEDNPDLVETKEVCDLCQGSGAHTCECGDEHECRCCNGTGKTVEITLLDMYRSIRAREEAHLEKWLNRFGSYKPNATKPLST
jgi:DnaJ-class molecular chaperone